MSSSGKFIFGAALGAVIGALFGIAYAPRKGSETRQIIKDDLETAYQNSVDNVGHAIEKTEGMIDDAKHTVKSNIDELSHKIQDSAETLKQKAKAISDDLEEAGENALGKLTGQNT